MQPATANHHSLARNICAALVLAFALASCGGDKSKKEEAEPSVEELYAVAKKSMQRKNWVVAIEQLRALEAKYPYGKYAEQAQLDIAYSQYRNHQPQLAITEAERFIKLHPTHPAVDYAYYLRGLASYEEDDSFFGRLVGRGDLSDRDANITRNALNAFNDVFTLFPESKYAADSKARADYLANALAQHEIAVANFYYAREAHVAVVNRVKGVLENYPDSTEVEIALGLLFHSYQRMGLVDLAADSRRVLALNYPNSRYLGEDDGDLFERKWYSATKSRGTIYADILRPFNPNN